MRFLGFEFRRVEKAAVALAPVQAAAPWWTLVRESFTGAWQRNVTIQSTANVLAFSAVYAAVTTIASDVAKLPIRTMLRRDGIWRPIQGSRITSVFRKPNPYQTRSQFIESVVLSRLIHGNAYILKQRDRDGQVVQLFVLEPTHVTVLVGEDGSAWYKLKVDNVNGIGEEVLVPRSEIIHERGLCLFHPLVGVSPIFACAWSATLGSTIQRNSAAFFANGSRPSGVLMAPGQISAEQAAAMKATWDAAFSGENAGKVAVIGDGLKYESMVMRNIDAQLVEQLKWSVEDVARCFRIPLYLLAAGQQPTHNNIQALGLMYLSQTLQGIIESLELGFDAGFDLPEDLRIEFDTDELLRMDAATRFDAWEKGIRAGWLAPNEVRRREDLPPVEGGESPYLQQQNYSLAALAERDAPPSDAQRQTDEEVALSFADAVRDELEDLIRK